MAGHRTTVRKDHEHRSDIIWKRWREFWKMYGQHKEWQVARNATATKIGDLAPGFRLEDVKGENPVRLSDLSGRKPVALVFGSFT